MLKLSLPSSISFILLSLIGLLSGCRDKNISHYQIPKEEDTPPQTFAGEAQAPSTDASLHWSAPADWESKPGSGMRVASFVARGSKDEVLDVSIVSFPGDGGEDLANVNRWRGQVSLAPLTADQLASYLKPIESLAGTLQLTDSLGVEKSGKPAQRMLAAWLRQGGKAWFFKMLGDSRAVDEQKNKFITFLKSISIDSNKQEVTTTTAPNSTASQDMSSTPVPTVEGVSLQWTPQPGWITKPQVAMRKATFGAGDAEIAISAFPGDVGGSLANVNRWRGQVGLAAIDQSELDRTSTVLDNSNLHFTIVEAIGPNAKAVVAGLLPWNGSTWFFKLTGSSDAVEKQKVSFLQFLKTVKTP